MNKTEIKPCPFCGTQPIKTRTGLSEVYAYADKVVYNCPGCGCSRGAVGDTSKGGYADNSKVEALALDHWNMRYEPDAKRYRWLRDKSQAVHNFYISVPIWFKNVKVQADSVDAYIDEAIKLEAEHG